MKRINMIIAILCIAFSTVVSAETNDALDAWKSYAAKTGNPDHAKWVDEISKPEAIALAKAWKELRGYDAQDLVQAEKLPAELKPGLVITKDNAGDFPWLKDYLPKTTYASLTSNDWGTIGKITIVPTNTYYMTQAALDSTKKLLEKNIVPTINEKGELLNPDGSFFLLNDATARAVPFIHPKNGMELNWSYVSHGISNESEFFKPIRIGGCGGGANAKLDRYYEGHLWWQKFHGRRLVEPMGDVPGKDELVEGGSIFFTEPFDIRGLAGVRQRYASADKADDFRVFIPSLRRTRIMTGSDAQDPIAAGVELIWDDWRAYWNKTNPDNFEYNLTGEGFILALPEVGYVYDAYEMNDERCALKSIEVELRPVWKLEIIDKTGKYIYKTRTTWVDKENYYMQYHITTDQRDNVMRIWDDSRAFRPTTGEAQWRFVLVSNYLSERFNFLEMESVWENREQLINDEKFDVDQLRDYR
ncbi:MAG: hypothetical protein K9K86_03425 [Pseudomonadales bacterium]|nr:hypothetical protein [Pseudomonadales bacterium]